MGNGCVSIAVRAYGRQTRRQIHWQHPRQRTSRQRTAAAHDSVFGHQLHNRPVHSLAAGQHAHPHFAIVESGRLCDCKGGHM